ncbi:hypothetical protein [Persephonella sp.]
MRVSEAKVLESIFGRLINLKTFMVILIFSVSFGWISDGLFELFKAVFQPFSSRFNTNQEILSGTAQFLTGFFAAAVLFLWAKKEVSRLNISIDVVQKNPEKKKNLIVFLSPSKNLEEIKKAGSVKELEKTNWLMPVIAVDYHRPTLENVLVISSKASEGQFDEFKGLIGRLFPEDRINVERYPEIIDFENIEEVYKAVKNAHQYLIKNKKAKRVSEIILDVTGGQKITSIAGAIFTTDSTGKTFQYVSTSSKKVVGFDILVGSED